MFGSKMISKFGILVIAACTWSASTSPVPSCDCQRELEPVCGHDGITYNNDCLLKCANTELSHYGECESEAAPAVACVCGKEMKPVCGSDGKTYSNECLLNCATAQNSRLSIARLGSCEDEHVADPLPPCTCTRESKPVCGSDGNTYSNECMLNCATAENSRLSVVSFEPCENDQLVDPLPPCMCTREKKPVCGSDGNTYSNECMLNCATAKNSRLSISHEGACPTVDIVNSPVSENDQLVDPYPTCICNKERKLVCGSDRKTYSNECLLNCATAKNPRLSISYVGSCEDTVDSIFPPCNCPDADNPVCGSDGNTYMNDCILNCETAKDSTLRLAHFGACNSVLIVDPVPSCICNRERKPVCGSDGKTYDNECLLNCATARDSTLRVSHVGSCLSVKVVDPFAA